MEQKQTRREQNQGGGDTPTSKPGKWQGKARKNSTEKGDIYWQPTLHMWNKCQQLEKQLGQLHTIGSDLWYENPPAIEWKNLQRLIVGLNMRGWGDRTTREMLWNTLTRTRTMIAVLIDHRQHTNTQRKQMEEEITRGWTGQGSKNKCKWAHADTISKRVGGVTLAVHPIMARYVRNTDKGDDPRGWGRWKGVQITGRKKKTLIIGTYAPAHNTKKTAQESMWQIMIQFMAKMRSDEKEKDPMM